MKQLKEATLNYGAQAPFTLSLMESFVPLNLAPGDWQQLCRAALSGGDYLIWRGEFQERCSQTAQRNVQAGQPQRNVEMLTGSGQYATAQQQMQYGIAVYAQVEAAAQGAWKALPSKEGGDHLSRVLQGPSEPFQDFVDRLSQVTERIFGGIGPAMPIIKQMAFENANKYCKEALRPHRNKSLNDYIRICRDINGNFIQGQVLAATNRPQGGKKDLIREGEKHVSAAVGRDTSIESALKIVLLVSRDLVYAPAAKGDIIGPLTVTLELTWGAISFLLIIIKKTGRGPCPRTPKPMCMGQ